MEAKLYLVRKGSHGELLELGRKKGHSWSKVYDKGGAGGALKRPKLDNGMHRKRMDELQEDTEDQAETN